MSYNHFLPQGFIPGPIQVPIDSPKSAYCVKCPRNAHENAFTLYIDKQKSLIENRKLLYFGCGQLSFPAVPGWVYMYMMELKRVRLLHHGLKTNTCTMSYWGFFYMFLPSHFISRSANTGENKHYYLSSNRYFRTISFIGHLYGQTYLWAYRNCASSGLIARAQSGQSMRNTFKMYAEATHFKNKS